MSHRCSFALTRSTIRAGLTLNDRVKADALICGSPRKYWRNSPSEQGVIETLGFLVPG
jgi:hypothetical protein